MHHVRSANFRLKTASENVEPRVRQEWQRWFEFRFTPLLDQTLSQWQVDNRIPPERLIDVAQLNVNIGQLSENLSDAEILSKLEIQVYPQLRAQCLSVVATNTGPVISRKNQGLADYCQFLQFGQWPFASAHSSVIEIESWFLQDSQNVDALIKVLIRYRRSRVVWLRFLYQHSEAFLVRVAACLPESEPIPNGVAITLNMQSAELCALFWRLWTGVLHVGGVGLNSQPVKNALLDLNLPIAGLSITQFVDTVIHAGGKLVADDSNTKEMLEEADAAATGFIVQQAGVVLLHPFLQSLFDSMGCLHNNEFKTEVNQLTAIAALQFAATGSTEADESCLLLHKWLVGWPLSKPLPRKLHLPLSVQSEITAMLEAVIGHWAALKNTSIEGLRETFFQRSGSLKVQETGYILYVEQRSVDILLKQLPWGFELVVLPWLKQPLYVSWEAQ